MGLDRRALVVTPSRDQARPIWHPRDEVPLLLIQVTPAVRKSGAVPIRNLTDRYGEAHLLLHLTPRRLLRSLALLNSSTGQVPVAAPLQVRIMQEEYAPGTVNECDPRNRPRQRRLICRHGGARLPH